MILGGIVSGFGIENPRRKVDPISEEPAIKTARLSRDGGAPQPNLPAVREGEGRPVPSPE